MICIIINNILHCYNILSAARLFSYLFIKPPSSPLLPLVVSQLHHTTEDSTIMISYFLKLPLSLLILGNPAFAILPTSRMSPSLSSPPTETCYWVDIVIVYDGYEDETSWELERVVGNGINNELVKSHQAAGGDTAHIESICLQEGEYEFTIYDYDAGICCNYGEGHYNVTSNGTAIVEGGEFEDSESTTFSIPFALFKV